MNNYIGPDELIFTSDLNGNIYSGGFNVNSIMMKKGLSPITTLNSSNASQIGGADKVSDLFNNLVVPNWVLSYNYKNLGVGGGVNKNKENEDNSEEDDIVEEELHEKLLNLVRASEDELKKQNKVKPNTKKNKFIKPKKTTRKIKN